MSDKAAKRKRSRADDRAFLCEFRAQAPIPQASLAATLKLVREKGLPDVSTRWVQWKSRKERTSKRLTPFGFLVQTIAIGEEEVAIQHPAAMLWVACKDETSFGVLLKETVARNSQPLHLIFYCDEVGISPLTNDTRKSWGVYWSIAEFGPEALCRDTVWFVVCAARSTLVADFGGVSRLMKDILKIFFIGMHSFECGIILHTQSGEVFNLVAGLGFIVADEAALKGTFSFKGAPGLKLCSQCMNILSASATLLLAATRQVSSTCLDETQFIAWTDNAYLELMDQFKDAADQVANGDLTKVF